MAHRHTALYAVLGVTADASAAEIRRAYRQLALRHHPDKAGGNADQFKAVAQAFEVLGDPARRSEYDRLGQQGSYAASTSSGPSPEEIFRQVFGHQFGATAAQDLAAMFHEMAKGNSRPRAPHPLDVSRTPPPFTSESHRAMVMMLQKEFAAAIVPPPESAHWSRAELRTFFKRGGGNWVPLRPWMRELHLYGSSASVTRLTPWAHPTTHDAPPVRTTSVLALLDAGDDAAFRSIARHIAVEGTVALTLGLDASLFDTARAEATEAVGAMHAAVLPWSDHARGDQFVRLSQYAAQSRTSDGGASSLPVLRGLHETLAAVGAELSPLLADDPELGLVLFERSDLFITCVPTGAAVSPHFDSACTAPGAPLERKLSLTIFLGSGDDESSDVHRQGTGGAELLFDQRTEEWRAVSPSADTLLISLSDRVMHKVAPAQSPRLSVSAYFLGGYRTKPDGGFPASTTAPSPRPPPHTSPLPHQRAPPARASPNQPDPLASHHSQWRAAQHLSPAAHASSLHEKRVWQHAPPLPATTRFSPESDDDDHEGAMDELG